MRQGQFSMEFIMIFSLVFLLFMIIATVIVGYSDSKRKDIESDSLRILADSITDKITLAQSSGTSYQGKLNVPMKIDDQSYNIDIIDGDLLVLRSDADRYETKIPNITGTIIKGCNNITKSEGVLRIVSC
jgi:hypothetical protein